MGEGGVRPDTAEKKSVTHLDIRMVNTPIVAIEQTKEEVMGMNDRIDLNILSSSGEFCLFPRILFMIIFDLQLIE